MKAPSLLLGMCAIFTALLSACGGGSASSSIATGNLSGKYVGVWITQCRDATLTGGRPVPVQVSSKQIATITRLSDAVYTLDNVVTDYVGFGCTGAGSRVAGEGGADTFTIVGTKVVASGETTDKVTSPITGKNLVYVDGGGTRLQVGNYGGAKDADGYPNALLAEIYTKQ